DEVHVADVVEGHQCSPAARDVFVPGDDDLLTQDLEERLAGHDDRRIGDVAHGWCCSWRVRRVGDLRSLEQPGQRRVARNSAIRPMASSRISASGSVTIRKWSGRTQLKPVPWVTRIFLARSRSSTNSWS